MSAQHGILPSLPSRPPISFVGAAGRLAPTALYDPVMALTMREGAWRKKLVAQVAASDPATVLELGCGTGSVTRRLAAALPDARITGSDIDPDILSRAARKFADLGVEWILASATSLPLADDSVDAVVCSLVLHHLDPAPKAAALAEARRVLRPGGRLHVADWGMPRDPVEGLAFLGLRLVDGMGPTRQHATGALPALLRGAGFDGVVTHDRFRTAWGALELLSADAPQ